MRALRHRNTFPRDAVDAPSLAAFKSGLAGALSSLVPWKGIPARGRGLELGDFPGPF